MKTNRIIASALAFIMATTAAASSVFAAGETVTIGASKTEAKAGSSFTVDITLADVPATGIMGCEFAIKYDSSVLTVTGVEAGAIANTGSDSAETDISSECPSFYADYSTAGTINLTWSTGLDDASYWIASDGVLATISGTVASGAAAGEYPVEITAISRDDISGTNASIYVGYIDANNASVVYESNVANGAVVVVEETVATTTTTTDITTTTTTTEPQPGTTTTTTTTNKPDDSTTTTTTTTVTADTGDVTTTTSQKVPVTEVKYGDVNLDGIVSMVDLVYLNKANASIISLNDAQKANADCAADGTVTAGDAQALLKFLVLSIKELPVIPS